MPNQAAAKEQAYLEGVTVLDFTQYLAGPACTRLLTEMGANVIKVEIPPYGDPQRSAVPRRNKRSGAYVQQNRGKRSLCVDLRRPEGVALVKEVVPHVECCRRELTARASWNGGDSETQTWPPSTPG